MEHITNRFGMTFVRIPAGTFWMGAPESDEMALDDEKPQHQVTMSEPFYMGLCQVTQGQWEAVMGHNPSHFQGDSARPVESVSWHRVQTYLAKLSELDGRPYTLPTEAQWEYACRGGSTGRFCFGDDFSNLGNYAWYDDNRGDGPHAVGHKHPNPWGLYDMHGNVGEWCLDGKRAYTADAVSDPVGPLAGAERVFRGGDWYSAARYARAAMRFAYVPGGRYRSIGFRCVMRT
ncbi:formylglycine-generating enzyme family protein [Candidatus Entotheonella palauensis]|uniref:formylglycine-generating enzyme family protein n=1 Tax=Candidatus Entotheonella palauensis TaxID=93172 RepID=UPI000B7FB16C|nr:formylglycine-generating enzyme family protein [Candidatus Entotheonella palauensis]